MATIFIYGSGDGASVNIIVKYLAQLNEFPPSISLGNSADLCVRACIHVCVRGIVRACVRAYVRACGRVGVWVIGSVGVSRWV